MLVAHSALVLLMCLPCSLSMVVATRLPTGAKVCGCDCLGLGVGGMWSFRPLVGDSDGTVLLP